jgi:hypothetical protein
MSWKTRGLEIIEKSDEVRKQTIRKTRSIPRIVNTTHFIRVCFLFLKEPVLEYDAFYFDDRSIHFLASEQKTSSSNIKENLEDIDLPPDVD